MGVVQRRDDVCRRTVSVRTTRSSGWRFLAGIRYRAARIVADVKLHTGQFTYDECVDWMNKTLEIETEADEQYIRSEVRRYTYSPTIQMCYLMGKREIELLKEATMRRDGANFSERAFYDRFFPKETSRRRCCGRYWG